MSGFFFLTDSQYALNHCTKYLARFNAEARHAFTDEARRTLAGTICEAWRFPIVDAYGGGAGAVTDPRTFRLYNQVTFVYRDPLDKPAELLNTARISVATDLIEETLEKSEAKIGLGVSS